MLSVSPPHLLLLVGAGFIGGFVNAIAGGGSLIVFPALVATGLGSVIANVTNSVALWPGYIGNIVGLGRDAVDEFRQRLDLVLLCTVGAISGSAILLLTPSGAFDVIVPLLVLVATTLIMFQPRIARMIGAEHQQRPVVLRVVVAIGALYGGYFGGGLGVILLAAIGLAAAAPLKEMNRLKSVLQLVVSTVSLVTFLIFATISWAAVAAVAPAALIGGVVGGRAARVVDEQLLRKIVVIFGYAIGVWLAIRAFR